MRVPARERVARRPGARGFHDGEVRVEHPGPGDAEAELQKLVGDGADEAGGEDVEAQALADAPVDGNGQGHINCLAAQLGDEAEQRVQSGAAYALPAGREIAF